MTSLGDFWIELQWGAHYSGLKWLIKPRVEGGVGVRSMGTPCYINGFYEKIHFGGKWVILGERHHYNSACAVTFFIDLAQWKGLRGASK